MASLYEIRKHDYDKIVAYIGPINKKDLQCLSNKLKWLQLASHGLNGFEDRSLYKNKNIWVSSVKDVYAEPIAQYCITAYYLFNTFAFRSNRKGLKVADCRIVNHVTVLIIGLGNIGAKLAKKCKALGWSVLGVKRTKTGIIPEYVDGIFLMHEVDRVLSRVDYVVNLLPETQETIHIYDLSFFSKMNSNALFCNVGRKSAVVDQDLIKAVKLEIIRGAILDVHNNIDYGSSNIILTGHNSTVSSDTNNLLADYFCRQIDDFINGIKPQNTI